MTPRQLKILTAIAAALAVIATGDSPVIVIFGVIAGFAIVQRLTRGSSRKS